MADLVWIDINPIANPTKDRKAEFNPPIKTVMVGELVFWRNHDEQEVHQPRPAGGANNAWVKTSIAKKLGDQPGTSNTRAFLSGTTTDGAAYVCAIHPKEAGTIIVRNNIDINNVPGAGAGDPQAAFNPDSQTVKAGEAFIWSNNDIKPHWPAPSVQQKTAWIKRAIDSGQKSETISISDATGEDGLTYVCALHPKEKGTLIVE